MKYGPDFFAHAIPVKLKKKLKIASKEASTSSKMIQPVSNTGNTASFNWCDAEFSCQNTYQSAETDVAHLVLTCLHRLLITKNFWRPVQMSQGTLENVHAIDTQFVSELINHRSLRQSSL